MKRFWRPSLAVAPVLAFGLVMAGDDAAIHECKDANGVVVFQSEPCSEVAPVAPGPPSVAKPSTKPASKPVVPAVTPAAKASKPTAMPIAKPTAKPTPKLEPRAASVALDSKWGTPESALKTFLSAVKAGDRELVLSCLTSSALAELGPSADALPMDSLRTTVGTFTGYVNEGDVGPFWSIRALRADNKPKWIFLERTAAGEWKVGGF